MRTLLLDHDDADAVALTAIFAASGFDVIVAASLQDATAQDLGTFEAVVRGTRGAAAERAEHCRRLREAGYLGAILAVCKDAAEGDASLDAGADDFVTAPFEAREIVTRVRVCIGRASARARLRWGPMDLDRVGRVVRVHGRAVTLTDRECALLACLMEAGGRVVSRATLRERVWQREDRGTNLVEVHLSRLRDKLGEDANLVETVRREGYRLKS